MFYYYLGSGALGPLAFQPIPFSKAGNPIMSTVAFLASVVDPRIAAAAAKSAMEEFAKIKDQVPTSLLDSHMKAVSKHAKTTGKFDASAGLSESGIAGTAIVEKEASSSTTVKEEDKNKEATTAKKDKDDDEKEESVTEPKSKEEKPETDKEQEKEEKETTTEIKKEVEEPEKKDADVEKMEVDESKPEVKTEQEKTEKSKEEEATTTTTTEDEKDKTTSAENAEESDDDRLMKDVNIQAAASAALGKNK
jgi:SWI/SNF related-matrix-associated actin-dependent regulator of chromatin subfamily C